MAILLLIDEDVPQSVANLFAAHGHDVHHVRDELMPGSTDLLVARWADEQDGIVVTCNHRHFKRLIEKVPKEGRQRFRKAGLITIECTQPMARRRVEALLPSIEFEFGQARSSRDPRLLFRILTKSFSVSR